MSDPTESLYAAGACFALVFSYKAVRERGGVSLLMLRGIHRYRAAVDCAGLCWAAAMDEWRRMWPSCLARKQRER